MLTVAIVASLQADKRDRKRGIIGPHDLPVTDAVHADQAGGVDPDARSRPSPDAPAGAEGSAPAAAHVR